MEIPARHDYAFTPMQEISHSEDTRLSIVVAGRNDDYAEGFLHRYHCFLSHLAQQVSQLTASVEVIVVDWNPPEDTHRLSEGLGFLALPPNLALKFIEVPASIHRSLENSAHIPLFEYRAKNVGIRRASGEFVLATNPDVLFNDELLQFICQEPLLEDGYYRAERHNFSRRLSIHNSPAENLDLAADSITFSSLFQPHQGERQTVVEGDRIFGHAGDFWLAHRSVWSDLFGYREFMTSGHMDSIICLEAIEQGYRQWVLPSKMRVYHQNHPMARAGRPGTHFNNWREWCERDDRETDRSQWGLTGATLPEHIHVHSSRRLKRAATGWTTPSVTSGDSQAVTNSSAKKRIPVSLGGGCDVATEFLRPHRLSNETHFFDYLWNLDGGLRNVSRIIQRRFAEFDREDDFVRIRHPEWNTPECAGRVRIACGDLDAEHLCHRVYQNISFFHYHPERNLTQKFRRKAQRFLHLLDGDQPLAFIYYRQYHGPINGNYLNGPDYDISDKLEHFQSETEEFVSMMTRHYPSVDFRLLSCFAGPGPSVGGISERIAAFIENLADTEHVAWRQVLRRGQPAAIASWAGLLDDI
jgi:hypothetical protein